MPATSMLSSMQKVLRSLLVGDDEVIPARGCSRADGVAEPTSPPAPLVGGPSQRSEALGGSDMASWTAYVGRDKVLFG